MLRIIPIVMFCAAACAAADSAYRLISVDAASWPRARAVLDVRPGAATQPVRPSEFRMTEDETATSVSSNTLKFRDSGMGLALIVALDLSPSMEGRPLNAIRQGLARLAGRRRELDRVAILSFADDVHWETRWDASAAQLRSVFTNLQIRGRHTRLYDAVGQAMDEFTAQSLQDSSFPSRQCILVLSDGADEGSRINLAQITTRLQNSRIRLDAVGLAHLPHGLSNLQALAAAGFGGFRTASQPEDLAWLLEDGMGVLLDSPVVGFQAERLTSDGKRHQVGVEHLPSHWRDRVAVQLPRAPLLADRRLWAGAGAALLIVICSAVYLLRRKPVPVQQAVSSAPVSPASASPSPSRGVASASPAVAPPASRAAAVFRTETALEPQTNIVPTPPPPRAPARLPPVATVLAPQGQVTICSLSAVSGPYAGQRFSISVPEYWIGSGANNHLCLNADSSVSGNHACIWRENRFYRIFDNGSLNQTTVNGRPIGSDAVLLRAGDRLGIGQSEFVLEA